MLAARIIILVNDTSFLFGVALCWTLLLLLFFGSWIFWVEVELQQRLLNRWDLTLLLRKWLLLQQQVSLLELHLRAEGSSDSTRLCLDIFQMCIGHFLLCTLHKLMIGTENSYYSNSCCCSTHPDPIWNLEATIDIEHQIKSVLYYWWSQVKKSSEARFLTWWFQRQQIFKKSWWFQRTVNLPKIHQFLGIFTNVMDFKIRSLNLCLKG